MIEIISMTNSEGDIATKKEKREKPNKIKQVGQPTTRKIYIEDYVITYLGQLAKKTECEQKIAIFFGEIENDAEEQNTYVEGAIELDQEINDVDKIEINEHTWKILEEKRKQYFSDKTIVGWYILRPSKGCALNENIYKAQTQYFCMQGQILFLQDINEREEAVYSYDNGNLRLEGGHYIFYARNKAMQNYMVEGKEEKSVLDEYEKVMDKYRKLETEKKEDKYQKKIVGILYATSSALTIIVLVIGIVLINNYDKMKNLENSLNNINTPTVTTTIEKVDNLPKDSQVSAPTVIDAETITRSEVVVVTPSKEPNDVIEVINPEPIVDTKTEDDPIVVTTTENDPVVVTRTEEDPIVVTRTEEDPVVVTTTEDEPAIIEPKYTEYTVKEGDTLINILYAHYANSDKLKEVQRINDIKDTDKILIGQIILLP